jgi:hypothetical protein
MKEGLRGCHFKDAGALQMASYIHCRRLCSMASRNILNNFTKAGGCM